VPHAGHARASEADHDVLGLGVPEPAALTRSSLVNHARGHGQRIFSVASPARTRTTVMTQKRTMTRGSGQPLSSKW